MPTNYTGNEGGGPTVAPVIDDAATRLTKAWFWAIVTTWVIAALLWVGQQQAEHTWPWIDQGLDLLKERMLWVAYGFEWAPVGAGLAQAR